jgi:hypothetical protein
MRPRARAEKAGPSAGFFFCRRSRTIATEEFAMRSIPPATLLRALVVAAAGLACSFAAPGAGDKGAYEKAKASAKSTYEAGMKRCDAMAGNARNICVAEVNEARTKTEAYAEAAYQDTPKARASAVEQVAEAHYKVDRQRCDDRTGNDRDVCIKVAKAGLTRAKADAKAHLKSIEARSDADKTKRQADYDVAVEKCDALSGAAKSACVQQAKGRYGM